MSTLLPIRSAAERIAHQAVRLYRLRAILWVVGISLFLTLAVIGLDYWTNVDERGLRWLFTLLWLAGVVATGWYWLVDAWRFRLNSILLAEWIEARHPELRGQLSNLLAVDQLPKQDLRFGSDELRQAALHNDLAPLQQLNWATLINHRALLVSGLACLLAVFLGLGMGTVNPQMASLGLARIVAPWSATAWPRVDQLDFVDLPSLIAVHHELEVQVVDARPPFPIDARIELRSSSNDDRSTVVTRLPLRIIDELAVVTTPPMERDFAVRVLGGDQRDAKWHDVKVARRPALKEHHFAIEPPRYTGQPAVQLVGQRIEVLAGSRARLHGTFDTPVTSVAAIDLSSSENDAGSASGVRHAWQSELASDGLSFTLALSESDSDVLQRDQSWRLEITTPEGLLLRDEHTWTIKVVADQAPTAYLQPFESTGITRRASFDVSGQAADDLGLTELSLHWKFSGIDEEHQQVLWRQSAPQGEINGASNVEPTKTMKISNPWPPADLELVTGQSLVLELQATDTAGQHARSLPQTIAVLDDQAMLTEMQKSQAEAFDKLRELAQAQSRANHLLERTQEMIQAAGQVSSGNAEALSSAAQLENSIAEALVRSPESVLKRFETLEQRLQRNHLGQSALAKDIQRVREQLQQLQQDSLESSNSAIQQAARVASEGDSSASTTLEHVAEALKAARQLAAQMDSLTKSIASVESLAQTQRQFQELLSGQQAVMRSTEQLQVDTLASTNRTQLESQSAGVRSDQQELARNVADMMSKLNRELSQSNEASRNQEEPNNHTQTLERVRQKLMDQQVAQKMRQASDRLSDNQLSEAVSAQGDTVRSLQDIVRQFNPSEQSSLEGSSSVMQDLARQLKQLTADQAAMADRFEDKSVTSDSAKMKESIERQLKLAKAMEQMTGQASIDAEVRQSLANAAQSAKAAAQFAQDNNLQPAAERATQSAQQLVQAEQQANKAAEAMRQQLARQQLFDLSTLFGILVTRQTVVVEKLESLEPTDTPVNEKVLSELISSQRQTLQQLREGRSQTELPSTFDWLLMQCEDELVRSVAAMERQRIKPEALISAQAALNMCQAALAALEEATSQNQPSSSESGEAARDSEKKTGPTAISLTSLKVLREMQTLINQQCDIILESAPNDSASLERLAQRQQALAQQVQSLILNSQ